MYRHGELILKKVSEIKGKKLNHLILAEGEVTGHKHEIVEAEATLYQNEDGVLYLSVKSEKAKLIHPDHKTIELPQGDYEVVEQREYVIGDEKYRKVVD